MNEELNKKLAEWAGWRSRIHNVDGFKKWYSPLGFAQQECPEFIQSLDACFKWLVPKYISVVCTLPMGLTSIMSIYTFLFAEWLKVMSKKVEPALALCLAIEKLIDNDKSK